MLSALKDVYEISSASCSDIVDGHDLQAARHQVRRLLDLSMASDSRPFLPISSFYGTFEPSILLSQTYGPLMQPVVLERELLPRHFVAIHFVAEFS